MPVSSLAFVEDLALRVPLIIAFELRVEDFFGWQGTKDMAYWLIFRVFRVAVQPEKYSLSGKIELLEVPLMVSGQDMRTIDRETCKPQGGQVFLYIDWMLDIGIAVYKLGAFGLGKALKSCRSKSRSASGNCDS